MAIATEHTHFGQELQIFHCRMRMGQQRHGRGIRGDDQVIGKPALEAEARNPKGAVLPVEVGVGEQVGRFRDAPRDRMAAGVADLLIHRNAVGRRQQGSRRLRHDERGHQIFKHRPAPTDQAGTRGGTHPGPTKVKPMLLRNLPGGDRHVRTQS